MRGAIAQPGCHGGGGCDEPCGLGRAVRFVDRRLTGADIDDW
jgi:hypothetical protein